MQFRSIATALTAIIGMNMAPNVVVSADGVITGACTCTVTKCENTMYVNGCGGQLQYGQTTAVYCSPGPSGNQQIFGKYTSYVYNRDPLDGCGSSSTGSDSCDCQLYTGTDFGDMTIQQFTTNAQGFVTDRGYYSGSGGVTSSACVCDIEALYNPNPYGDESDATVFGYYALGTPSQPAYCDANQKILAMEGGSQIGFCGYFNPSTTDALCNCEAVSGTPNGNVPNSTSQAQTAPSPIQSLINVVASQIAERKGGGGGSSGGGSSGSGGSSSGSSGSGSSTNGQNGRFEGGLYVKVVMILFSVMALIALP